MAAADLPEDEPTAVEVADTPVLLVRGPATVPQPAFDVRERGGRIEVRLQG